MKTSADEKRVEILNNGSHLGWTNVTNGKWNYVASGLNRGSNRLTARVDEKMSSEWTVRFRNAVDRDNLDDAKPGPFHNLERTYFLINHVEGDPTGAISNRSFCARQIYPSPPDMPGGRSLYLGVRLYPLDSAFPYPRLIVDLALLDPYSMVSFTAKPSHRGAGYSSVVQALDSAGDVVQQTNFASWGDYAKPVSMGSMNARNIAKLRFSITVRASSDINFTSLFVDSFILTA